MSSRPDGALNLGGGAGSYRPDIDGLRAVAIAAVIACHAAPSLAPGGFAGVDVFFVISGFLITGIIAGQRDAGRFKFAEFYRRRARRILPAYFLVAGVTAAAAFVVLQPEELKPFGGTLAASSLFLTNLAFGIGSGYFQPSNSGAPLLHLWSLAVEEQFYLIWPLLIAGLSLRRLRPWRTSLLLLIAAASLAYAAWLVHYGPTRDAFYYLPSRAWEFLAGGLLAVGLGGAPRSRVVAELAAVGGLGLIVVSLCLLGPESPFPGLAALPPCLGAALLIWSGDGQAPLASSWLRARPVVGLGRISYSLYLWHWPILALARRLLEQPLSPLLTAALMVLALGLAILTWRFVEQPWRAGAPRWRHLGLAMAAAAMLFSVGLAAWLDQGFPGRMPPGLVLEETDINPMRNRCQTNGVSDVQAPMPDCVAGPARNAGDVVVWGDSHADAVTPGVLAWAQARDLRVRELTRGGCAPLMNVRVVNSAREADALCPAFDAMVLKTIAADPKIRFVVIAARWPLYLNAMPRMGAYDPPTWIEDASGPRGRVYALSAALDRTLSAIAATGSKAQVIVVGPIPELPFSPPACMGQALRFGFSQAHCEMATAVGPLSRANQAIPLIRQAVARHDGVRVVFPTHRLCTSQICTAVQDGDILYYDTDHLSASGARRLVPGWLDAALGGSARP